jgi:hypothetical protein
MGMMGPMVNIGKQTMFNELCILSEYSVEIVQSIGGK